MFMPTEFNHGDTREKIRFALLPTEVTGGKVWLEHYKLTEQYNGTTMSWRKFKAERIILNK